jgi:tryptophan halogenase
VPGDDVPSSADRVTAYEDGWTLESPLRGRTLIGRVGNEGARIVRGRRLRPWVHNVLALGDSATGLDPLHGFPLALLQSAIVLALELLPGRDFASVETDEYNRRMEQVTRRVRDFVVLHYLRSGRWPQLASVAPPDSLAETLDQYEHRGRLPFYEEESVTRDSWTAALLGLGVMPRNDDPQSLAISLEQSVPAMERLAAEIREIVGQLPSYADYLARIAR